MTPTSHHLENLNMNYEDNKASRKLRIVSSCPLGRQRFLKQDTKFTKEDTLKSEKSSHRRYL